uniref:ribosomal protein S3 n=1 Tax=Hypnea nidifica TaxID=673448 RepID=UPI0030027478|nr:ribosomal protein S3 [Hypnea nidifica]
MAQKINPTSVRLGISQLWLSNIQFYGKSFKLYFLSFHYYLRSFLFLRKVSNIMGFIIYHQQWKITKLGSIVLNLYYGQSFFVLDKNFLEFYKKIQKTFNILFLKKIEISFYLLTFSPLSKNLLHSYSQFLGSNNLTSKKILWNISILLNKYLNSSKLVYTPKGVKVFKLKGFKIQISGRIDDSKTQMAKSLNLNVGISRLTSLEDSIVYITNVVYSKSGICGLKIWLFYEFTQ